MGWGVEGFASVAESLEVPEIPILDVDPIYLQIIPSNGGEGTLFLFISVSMFEGVTYSETD